jgi:hypothetical protein
LDIKEKSFLNFKKIQSLTYKNNNNNLKMASNADQFADLELSKEDREQIFEDPHEGAQSHTPQNGSR